jgi:hypothetical protein
MSLLVVHLVRRQNGPSPLHAFLDSYVSQRAGAAHDLLLALKGFGSADDAQPYLEAAQTRGIDARHVLLPDEGLDLTAYSRVVELAPADRYCFLNSFSRVLADDWLGYLATALDDPGVGLAGATGSWASQLDYGRYQLGLPSAYSTVFEDREATRQGFLELARKSDPAIRDRGRVGAQLLTAAMLVRQARDFARFPDPHLRTNALAAEREMLLGIRGRRAQTKLDMYKLESGRSSLTASVLASGRQAVVVGRDGVLYDSDRWPESRTLWQGEQENLLVADNRTEEYQQAEARHRLLLARLAWGQRAQPA